MADSVPLIPHWLADRTTVGGLAVPWITPRTSDGRYLFGSIEESLAELALRQRRCGICARPLGDRLILLMRLSDLPRQCTNEPAIDPTCAHYTAKACPMINGRLATYRTSPVGLDREGGVVTTSAEAMVRQGAPAEPWFAVWLSTYRLIHDHGHLAASYAGDTPLRIRPITWRFLGIE